MKPVLPVVVLIAAAAVASARSWTSVDGGKTFEAEFVSVWNGTVVVDAKGTRKSFSINLLSSQDRAWLRLIQAKGTLRLIGYLPSYRISDPVLAHVDRFTDIVYFGAEIRADGSVEMSDRHQNGLAMLSKLTDSVVVHFCLGGWGKDKHFASVTADSGKRKTLLDELQKLQKTYGFQGVDYDWEYPRTPDELNNFALLIKETQEKFHEEFEVTAAFNPVHNVPQGVWSHLDRVHLMTYDLGAEHCATSHSSAAIAKWTKQGVPAEKLTIGAAFYARHTQNRSDVKTYAGLVEIHGGKVATENCLGGYFYDNKSTLQKKVSLIRENELAGLIIWEVGQDAADEKLSLGKHLKEIAR